MSPRKTKDIRRALLKKGFRTDLRDHEFFFLYVEGRKTSVRTKLSYGIREYGDGLLGLVATQLRLTRPQLNALIDCGLKEGPYVQDLIARREIEP